MTLEGYASLFGVADLAHDVIRAGAFRASIAQRKSVPMLVQHERRLEAGVWTALHEDARGLYIRGEIHADLPGAARAERMVARGIDGLSIGFVPIVARKSGEGRVLEEIDLVEVSLVTFPMQPLARLTLSRSVIRAA